jgi:hypothetical protein
MEMDISRLAVIQSTDVMQNSMSMAIHPSFSAWPKPKQNATLWLMANMIVGARKQHHSHTSHLYLLLSPLPLHIPAIDSES